MKVVSTTIQELSKAAWYIEREIKTRIKTQEEK